MRAVIWKFNKFSSYPLIVEAGRDLTGSIFFTELIDMSYVVGDFVDVYYDETIENRHYFRMSSKKITSPKEGDLVNCWFVKFKSGFGCTV